MLASKGPATPLKSFNSAYYSHLGNEWSSPSSAPPSPSLSLSLATPGTSGTPSSNNNIKVVCRFRPQNSMELENGGKKSVIFDKDLTAVQLSVGPTDTPPSQSQSHAANIFRFDRLFDEGANQEEVFQYTAESIVSDVMKGYNGTILAYGQTGAGKTFTMMGNVVDPENRGITPRIVSKIFDMIVKSSSDLEFTVKVSFMEIYMERVRDLLQPMNDNLPVHEDKLKGVYVKGLLEVFVGSVEEVLEVMTKGQSSRAVGSTSMNSESSRSHSIFQLCITQKNTVTGSTKTGKLSLVDLAGSEKAGKTGARGQTLEEAKKINKSLSSLGNVINSLTDGKSAHVPYRDSKLTRILQESLGGNARTSLIINCSPSSFNEAETISTLRFGVRAKSIKNNAKINTEISPAELKSHLKHAKIRIGRLEGQVASMGQELGVWRSGGQVADSEWAPIWMDETDDGIDEESIFNQTVPQVLPMDTVQEYVHREVELRDRIAEKESLVTDLQDQVEFLKTDLAERKLDLECRLVDGKRTQAELSEVRLSLEKAVYEAKESTLSLEGLREEKASLQAQVDEMKAEMGILRGKITEPTSSTTPPSSCTSTLLSQQDLDSALSDATNTITHLTAALENTKEENGYIMSRLDTVQSTLKQVQTEYQELLAQTFTTTTDDDPPPLATVIDRRLERQDLETEYLRRLVGFKCQEVGEYAEIVQAQTRMNDGLKRQIRDIVARSRDTLEEGGGGGRLLGVVKKKMGEENPHSDESSKTVFLQGAFEQFGIVQSQLIARLAQVQKEKELCERKLESRSERIDQIETQLKFALQQNGILEARYKDEVGVLEEKLKDAYAEIKAKALTTPWIQSSKIAKPLRGGTSAVTDSLAVPETSSTPVLAATTEMLSSPRSLQGKRSSWYVSLLKK